MMMISYAGTWDIMHGTSARRKQIWKQLYAGITLSTTTRPPHLMASTAASTVNGSQPRRMPLPQTSPMLAHCGAPEAKEIARMGEYCVVNLTRKMLTDLRFCRIQHRFQHFRICHQISRHQFLLSVMKLAIGW